MTEDQANRAAALWIEIEDLSAADERAKRGFSVSVVLQSAVPDLDGWEVVSSGFGPVFVGVGGGRLYKVEVEEQEGKGFSTLSVPLEDVSLETIDLVEPFGGTPGFGFRNGTVNREWRLSSMIFGSVALRGEMQWPEREWDWSGQRAQGVIAATGLA
jgi:hypothetical protein